MTESHTPRITIFTPACVRAAASVGRYQGAYMAFVGGFVGAEAHVSIYAICAIFGCKVAQFGTEGAQDVYQFLQVFEPLVAYGVVLGAMCLKPCSVVIGGQGV